MVNGYTAARALPLERNEGTEGRSTMADEKAVGDPTR